MRAELLERIGGGITRQAPAALDDWDQRFYRARPSCTENERPAFTELTRLRYGLGALSERFEREELPHLERLNELLGSTARGIIPRDAPERAQASAEKDP